MSELDPTKTFSQKRKGAVTVEFAVVCTMLFMFVFAGLEFSRVNMIRNTVEAAAYEGARCGIVPGATNAECIAAAQSYLAAIGIGTSTVTCTPAILDGATDITVDVNVPLNGNNIFVTPTFFAGKTVSSSIMLPCE